MPKEELLQFEGLVTEVLPDARFRVKLSNGHDVIACTSGRMKKNPICTMAGDNVLVEISSYDLNNGRLIFRHKEHNRFSMRASRTPAFSRPAFDILNASALFQPLASRTPAGP